MVEDANDLTARARRWKSPLTCGHALSVVVETLMYCRGQFDRACEPFVEALLAAERIVAVISMRTKARSGGLQTTLVPDRIAGKFAA